MEARRFAYNIYRGSEAVTFIVTGEELHVITTAATSTDH